MSDLVATTPGLLPLPDWAKSDLADLKGRQKADLISGDESPAVSSAYDRARTEVIDDQFEAGLDRVVEGQLRWDDMLAHPLTLSESVDPGRIVRYYDNNNFYRDPRVVDELRPSGDVAQELTAAAEFLSGAVPLQAVLPGPYTLADLATDAHYGDEREFLAAIGEFLASEVRSFPEHETLFLLEPSLVESPPDDDVADGVPEAIDAVASATNADVVVHTYYGALDEKTYAYLMDADVEAFGLDLVADDRDQTVYNAVEYGTPDDVALGVADGQNTRVESAETLRDRVEWFTDQVPMADFGTTYLSTNTELFYLPVNRYREKLAALAAAADLEPEVHA